MKQAIKHERQVIEKELRDELNRDLERYKNSFLNKSQELVDKR
jgi:hypothetical protein